MSKENFVNGVLAFVAIVLSVGYTVLLYSSVQNMSKTFELIIYCAIFAATYYYLYSKRESRSYTDIAWPATLFISGVYYSTYTWFMICVKRFDLPISYGLEYIENPYLTLSGWLPSILAYAVGITVYVATGKRIRKSLEDDLEEYDIEDDDE